MIDEPVRVRTPDLLIKGTANRVSRYHHVAGSAGGMTLINAQQLTVAWNTIALGSSNALHLWSRFRAAILGPAARTRCKLLISRLRSWSARSFKTYSAPIFNGHPLHTFCAPRCVGIIRALGEREHR